MRCMTMVGNVTREISSMRQPLWLLNFLLLLSLIFTLAFIFISKIKMPERKNLFVQEHEIEKEEPVTKIDPSVIYTKDLFGTTLEETKAETEKPETIPTPPPTISAKIPEARPVKFLEPLSITLTGIIFFDDKYTNRAIILDNRTKTESIYKFEDEIEDAQIIKIQKDHIILLRSNSQQEVLYLKQDIDTSEHNILTNNWSKIVSKKSENIYNLNVDEFTQFIKNLSDLIFRFDLKTAIKNKKTVGLAVGEIESKSLASAMGLHKGDIITEINNYPLTSQQDRLDAYNKIISEKPDQITIKLTSNGKSQIITYKLKSKKIVRGDLLKEKINENNLSSHEIEKQHKKYEDTLKEIKLRDKQNMFKYKRATPESK